MVGAPKPYISLFWRLFVPNATVLGVACIVLWVEPANGRIVALVGGLAAMLVVNLVLMRRAVSPLLRLAALMGRIDPLEPGRRVPVGGPPSEVAVLAGAFNEMLDRLEHERRDSARRALAAQQEERRRVSRELHDEIGQSLTALTLQLDRMAKLATDELRGELGSARDASGALVEDVRRLAQQLRPDVLDNLGLVPALRSLCDRLGSRSGVSIRARLAPDLPPLDSDAELVVYRVAQEALTNVVRHAGASAAEVRLDATGTGEVRLVVRDDGRGVGASPPGGSGIRFMRERAVLAGGRLRIGPAGERGTEVELCVPVGGAGG